MRVEGVDIVSFDNLYDSYGSLYPPGTTRGTQKKPENLFDKIVINGFSLVAFTMAILLVVLICTTTILRYVFQIDLFGYEEWVKLFAFWLYFSGAAMGAFDGTHISADVVEAYFPSGHFKRAIIVVKDLVTVGVSLLFVWYGYNFFMFGFLGPLGTGIALPKTTTWQIPLWTWYLAVLLGLLFMSVYFIGELVRSVKHLITGGRTS
ncbi:MAG: TRAP transporter small permease [Synergistales bacterium]|nr:TRAP transporter small permease [Synergistales bacterium]